MNIRDPFNIRQSNALTILSGTAIQATANITQRLLETAAHSIESGTRAVEDMSSFSVPKNVPSFTNPQRELENRVWGASGVTARSAALHQNGSLSSVQERLGGFFEKNQDLPMYKDKPYSYVSSRRRKPLWQRRRLLALVGLFIMFGLYMMGVIGDETAKKKAKDTLSWPEKTTDWLIRREKVVDAFKLSWDAYDQYAWEVRGDLDKAKQYLIGYDEFRPVSKQGKQMTPNGMGWIIVDSLDTLMLMNLTSRLSHARKWITTKLDYDQDKDVNTFETTIRMLGGFLSAHYLSTTFPDMAPLAEDDEGTPGEDLYLEKAKDLTDRIISAFESQSGIPYASFNLKTLEGIPSHTDAGASSTAEAGTVQLELKYITKLTGETLYWEKAEKVMQVIDDNGMEDGLLPIHIDPNTGKFRGDNIRLGSRGDSYYEYLIKQYLQTSKQEPIYEEMWDEALAGVRKHLITYSSPSGFTLLGERPSGLHRDLSPKMDHLVCFMPGTIALGATGGLPEAEARKLSSWSDKKTGEMTLARELMQTCWGMYKFTKTGLAGEITHFGIDQPPLPESAPHNPPKDFDASDDATWRQDFNVKGADNHNLQRPETVESLFYMWRITGEEKYREWGWEMFLSFMNYTAVEDRRGFTSLRNADVLPPVQDDNMESFWLAETLKYFYLLFSPNDLLPLDTVVINTEAHPLPRFELGKLLKTGWKRKTRAGGKVVDEAPIVGTVLAEEVVAKTAD